MSYQAKDFKVGDPIDRKVADHIDQLQKVFSNKSSRSSYIELQSALPWIKMQSGVNLDASAAAEYGAKQGSDLARKNILFGLNTRIDNYNDKGEYVDLKGYTPDGGKLPGYEQTGDLGIRPKPGITSLNIKSHNRFGSLRTATVSFQCWSKEQMDKIEVLYMRPGMTVLLEWGHSKYINSEGSVESSDFGIDYFGKGMSMKMTDIVSKIDKKRKETNYSYDGIVGIVKNFTWKFRPDGGYDCQVSLVTAGDLIESYKASFYVKQDEIAQQYQNQIQQYQQNQQNQPSGNNASTIKFPDVTADYANTSDDALSSVPILASTYSTFTGAAQSALDMLPQEFENYVGTLTDAEKDTLYSAAGFDTTGHTKADIQKRIAELIGSLDIVKYGQSIGSIDQSVPVSGTGTFRPYGTVELKVKTDWQNGLVNFNYGNQLATGEIEQGAISILPLRGTYSNTFDFLQGIREMQVNTSRKPIACINAFFELITKVQMVTGASSTPLFQVESGTVFNSGLSEEGLANAHQLRFIKAKRVPGSSYENFYGLEIDSPETNQGGAPLAFAYKFVSFGSAYSEGDGSETSLSTYLESAKDISIALFFKLNFVGYKAILAQQGSSSQVVNVNNAQGTADDSFVDPNDDNLSKLHFYLRTKFDTPYVNAYLNRSLVGRDFKSVFSYRFVPGLVDIQPPRTDWAPTAEAEAIFAEKNGTQRTDNLKMYDSDPITNTYEKQLLSWCYVLGGRFVSSNNTPQRNTVYIKLGALLELINRHVLQSDNGYFFLFKSMYKDDFSTPLYRIQDDHLSVDPEICILPTNISKFNISRSSDLFTTNKESPIILNIELGINFVLDTLNKYIDDQGQVTVLTFIQEILDEISRVCGGINNLQLQYREDSSLFYVVDRNAITPFPKSKYPQLNVFGLGSIIRDINMVSKITPQMSSMIAISAQDTAYTSTQDATGFGALNRGITDRIFSDRYDEDRKEKASITDYTSLRDQLIEDVVDLRTHILTYYLARTIPRIGRDTQVGVYQNYCNYLSGADSVYNYDKRPTYNFIIPFQVGLGIYGISGLQVMDAFRLDKEVLPKTYGGRVGANIAFLITGIEHSITNGNWTTQINTQIFNIEDTTGVKLYPNTDFELDRIPPNFNGNPAEPTININNVTNWAGSYSLQTLTKHPTSPHLDNSPTQRVLNALLVLDQNILVPITNQFGTMNIGSAFRNQAVNAYIGGSSNSQHMRGEAVDFDGVGDGSTLKTVFTWIADNLTFGQLIWELGDDNSPDWIHVSYSSFGNRQSIERYIGNNVYKPCDKFGKLI